MRMHGLRTRREELGLTPLELADIAKCSVEIVLHAEFGIDVPSGEDLQRRLAEAYRLEPREYLRMAFDAADGFAEREATAS